MGWVCGVGRLAGVGGRSFGGRSFGGGVAPSFGGLFFACFCGGAFGGLGVSLCCCFGGVVLSFGSGFPVLFLSLGVFFVSVCSFVLVGSPVGGSFVPAGPRSFVLCSSRRAVRLAVWRLRCRRFSARVSAWWSAFASFLPVPAFPVAPSFPFPVPPVPLRFPPAVWSPSPFGGGVAVAARVLLLRARCPLGSGVCSRCPCAVLSLPLLARLSGVPVASLLSCRALFSLPRVPLSLCVCALSGCRCVSPFC